MVDMGQGGEEDKKERRCGVRGAVHQSHRGFADRNIPSAEAY